MAKKAKTLTAESERPNQKQSTGVSHEEIIRAWQTSNSQAEVLSKLGEKITRANLSNHVANMRKRGIPLKRMPGTRHFTAERIASLTELAESLMNGDSEKP